MLKKAIAAHTIFIIGVIIIFIFFVTVILFGYIDWSKTSASKFACTAKLENYCSDWSKSNPPFSNTPWDWNSKGPSGCENSPININQPSSEDCKKLFPSLGS
jgi:hypothetical protein